MLSHAPMFAPNHPERRRTRSHLNASIRACPEPRREDRAIPCHATGRQGPTATHEDPKNRRAPGWNRRHLLRSSDYTPSPLYEWL